MSEVTADIDLLDSEILEVEGVIQALGRQQGQRRNLENFRREIIGRFEEIGIVADALAWTTTEDGTVAFEIVLKARCEPRAFDHDQMGWEVRSDILELGDKDKPAPRASDLWTPGSKG